MSVIDHEQQITDIRWIMWSQYHEVGRKSERAEEIARSEDVGGEAMEDEWRVEVLGEGGVDGWRPWEGLALDLQQPLHSLAIGRAHLLRWARSWQNVNRSKTKLPRFHAHLNLHFLLFAQILMQHLLPSSNIQQPIMLALKKKKEKKIATNRTNSIT